VVGGVELIHHRLRRHSIPQRSAEGWIRDVAGSSMNRTRKYHPDHRVTSLHPTLSSSTLSLHRPSDSSICLLLVHAACLLHHPFNHSSTIRPMSTYDMAVSHSHNHPYPALSSHLSSSHSSSASSSSSSSTLLDGFQPKGRESDVLGGMRRDGHSRLAISHVTPSLFKCHA